MVIRGVDGHVVMDCNLEQCVTEENLWCLVAVSFEVLSVPSDLMYCTSCLVIVDEMFCPCLYPYPSHPNITPLSAADWGDAGGF